MPPDHRVRFHQRKGVSPAAPHSAQEDPEETVGGPQAWPQRGAPEDRELVPQRELLEHQGPAAPEHEEEACKDEAEHAGHHRSGRPKVNVDVADGIKGLRGIVWVIPGRFWPWWHGQSLGSA
jgi:hypothetical protein